ncbi:MAG: hypothetical protein GHCLOJNM_01592 [bacterium]|nr:hypothetical protein [bacterium]
MMIQGENLSPVAVGVVGENMLERLSAVAQSSRCGGAPVEDPGRDDQTSSVRELLDMGNEVYVLEGLLRSARSRRSWQMSRSCELFLAALGTCPKLDEETMRSHEWTSAEVDAALGKSGYSSGVYAAVAINTERKLTGEGHGNLANDATLVRSFGIYERVGSGRYRLSARGVGVALLLLGLSGEQWEHLVVPEAARRCIAAVLGR